MNRFLPGALALLFLGCGATTSSFTCQTWCDTDVQHAQSVTVDAESVSKACDEVWKTYGGTCPGMGLRKCSNCR